MCCTSCNSKIPLNTIHISKTNFVLTVWGDLELFRKVKVAAIILQKLVHQSTWILQHVLNWQGRQPPSQDGCHPLFSYCCTQHKQQLRENKTQRERDRQKQRDRDWEKYWKAISCTGFLKIELNKACTPVRWQAECLTAGTSALASFPCLARFR